MWLWVVVCMVCNYLRTCCSIIFRISSRIWSIGMISLVLIVCCCTSCSSWRTFLSLQLSLRWKMTTLMVITMRLNILLTISTNVSSKACSLTGCPMGIYLFFVKHFHFLRIFWVGNLLCVLSLILLCSIRIQLLVSILGNRIISCTSRSSSSFTLLKELPICRRLTIYCLRGCTSSRTTLTLFVCTLSGARNWVLCHWVVSFTLSLSILFCWCQWHWWKMDPVIFSVRLLRSCLLPSLSSALKICWSSSSRRWKILMGLLS